MAFFFVLFLAFRLVAFFFVLFLAFRLVAFFFVLFLARFFVLFLARFVVFFLGGLLGRPLRLFLGHVHGSLSRVIRCHPRRKTQSTRPWECRSYDDL